MPFGTDQVLLYDVKPFNELGFGVANFADKVQTVNRHLWKLADEIGKLQLYIMTHVDAMRDDPPSRNTVERLGKLCNRINSVLAGRNKEYNELRVEPGHGQPAPRPWSIHPCPYFPGPIVKNGWLAEYNEYCMLALANIYQHTDNSLTLTLTRAAAGDIWSFFREIQRLLAVEMIGLTEAVVDDPAFQFTAEHYVQYAPDRVTVRIEAIAEPVDPRVRFTEADLRPFVRGIPANLIVANLSRYPQTDLGDSYGGALQSDKRPDDAAPGTADRSAIDPVI